MVTMTIGQRLWKTSSDQRNFDTWWRMALLTFAIKLIIKRRNQINRGAKARGSENQELSLSSH